MHPEPTERVPGLRDGGYSAWAAVQDLLQWLPAPCSLIPLHPRSKKPALNHWTTNPRMDPDSTEGRHWFSGEAGIGLRCGTVSDGICAVDIDSDAWIARVELLVPALGAAPKIIGARGCKWLVQCHGPNLRGRGLKCGPGVRLGEFLGDRQQAVLAGIHPDTGRPYSWARLGPIPLIDPAGCFESIRHHVPEPKPTPP